MAARLKDVLTYCLSTETGGGQALSKSLGYVPLPPDALRGRARKAIASIRTE